LAERVVFDGSSGASPRIHELIKRLDIPLGKRQGETARWLLTMKDGALSLTEGGGSRFKPLSVDLVGTRKKFRSLPIARRGPLVRALGRSTVSIIDATAGWGQDMFLMWLMGYDVAAVERSPVLGALLLDGLARLECHDPGPRYPVVEVCDAREYLAVHSAECVYLDPMFAPRRKTSPLAKRRLRVLRELVGDDDDRDLLFDAAWQAASRRVVVKRPNHAGSLRTPDESFSGKIMTYDLYLKTI